MVTMFERFTERARQVVVLAQEEARALGASTIGTEHLLLGLLAENDGIGAHALRTLGVHPEAIRAEHAPWGRSPKGQIPFRADAQQAIELSLREALSLGHNYIGTEHVLLGIVRIANEWTGARIVHNVGADRIRNQVAHMLGKSWYETHERKPRGDGTQLGTVKSAASTQYAGSGLCVNVTGIQATDAATVASEVGWRLRKDSPTLTLLHRIDRIIRTLRQTA